MAEFSIPGYSLFSCERNEREGGGVLLYVKTNLHPIAKSTTKIANINASFIHFNLQSRKIVIGIIYRPPSQLAVIDNQFYEQIAEICCENETVIFGDFNLPICRWGDPLNSHTGLSSYANLLESSLYQLVEQPTRGEHILDLVLTTNENIFGNVKIGPEFSSSNHRVITFSIQEKKSTVKESKEKVPDYQRANYRKLRNILVQSDCSELSGNVSVNEAWQIFTSSLNKAVDASVPIHSRCSIVNSKPKWWNTEKK